MVVDYQWPQLKIRLICISMPDSLWLLVHAGGWDYHIIPVHAEITDTSWCTSSQIQMSAAVENRRIKSFQWLSDGAQKGSKSAAIQESVID